MSAAAVAAIERAIQEAMPSQEDILLAIKEMPVALPAGVHVVTRSGEREEALMMRTSWSYPFGNEVQALTVSGKWIDIGVGQARLVREQT